jgi:hypothetical protein
MLTKCHRVGYKVLKAVVMNSSIFWDTTSCSPSKFNWRFGGTCRLHLQSRRINQARNRQEAGSKHGDYFKLVSCLAYFSNLKTEATCSSETSNDFQRTTRCYIPEDITLNFSFIPFKILKIFRLILEWSTKENSRRKWSVARKSLGTCPTLKIVQTWTKLNV